MLQKILRLAIIEDTPIHSYGFLPTTSCSGACRSAIFAHGGSSDIMSWLALVSIFGKSFLVVEKTADRGW